MNAPRLRLAIVRSGTASFDPAYYNLQELGLARALAREGVMTDIYVSAHATAGKVSGDYPSIDGVRVLPLSGTILPGHQATLTDIKRHLRQHRYHVVQVHEDSAITSLAAAESAARVGSVVVLRQGMYEDYSRWLPHLAQAVYDHVVLPRLRATVHVVAAKSRAAARYATRKGFRSVDVLPVGVDEAAFGRDAQPDWAAARGIAPDTRLVLYVGELSARRPIEPIMGALRALRDSGADPWLAIATRSAVSASLDRQLSATLRDRYQILHDVPQAALPSLYQAAAVVVMPSRYEIWGMAAAESLLFGTPVLASDTGGLADIIGQSGAGALVRENTAEAWRSALEGALSAEQQPALREAAMRRGQQLTWGSVAPRYLDFLNRACQGHACGTDLRRRPTTRSRSQENR